MATAMSGLDRIADALRVEDALIRTSAQPTIAWEHLTDVDRARWRRLAKAALYGLLKQLEATP